MLLIIHIIVKKDILKILKLDRLFDSFSKYLEDRIALLKIELKEEFAQAVAKLSLALASFIVFTIFLIFLSITIAQLLNAVWGSSFLGYVVVTSFYLLLFIILYVIRSKTSLRKVVEERIMEKLNEKK